MFERRLSYEETLKLIERGILQVNNVHICLDNLSKHSTDEWIIESINIDKDKQEIIFSVQPLFFPITSSQEPIPVPYQMIKEVSNMPIECLLEAYDMAEAKRVIEIYLETDIETDVIGKEDVEFEGYELYDGLQFILHNDKTAKYNDKILTVKGVGEAIRFVANRGRPRKKRN